MTQYTILAFQDPGDKDLTIEVLERDEESRKRRPCQIPDGLRKSLEFILKTGRSQWF